MTQYTKDPDATLDYQQDWSAWLGTDTIVASTWIVDTGLTVEDEDNDTTTATVWLSGGTVGKKYTAVNRITTAAGRTDDRSIIIYIDER